MSVKMLSEIPGLNMEDLKLTGFKVHELPAFVDIPVSRGRRDFYKMGLVTGEMTIRYGDQIVELHDTVLFFVNPNVTRSVVRRSANTTGYACIFTETFMTGRELAEVLKNSPLFQVGDYARNSTEQGTGHVYDQHF
jgi:AraC family transcriptional activator of pobA